MKKTASKALLCRVAALVLALALLPLDARAASEGSFVDVPQDHWAYESIRRATQYGLISGVSPKYFGMGQNVTRAQYAMMLCRLMGWQMLTPERGSFSDNQDPSAWYYSAIETAYAHGALLKLGAACNPNEPLPREDMAAMMVRALGYSSLAGVVQNDCPFADVTTNPGYIALAYHMGFMTGVSAKKFLPRNASTREQAAVVLLRVYDRLHAEVSTAPLNTLPSGTVAVYAESLYDMESAVPMCPRAPLEGVYNAALRAQEGEVVALRTQPWAVEIRDGKALPGRALSVEELNAYLRDGTTVVRRSQRYESSYLIYPIAENDRVYVWYETDEDIAAKVMLCRLMGVKTVYVE